MTDSRPSSPPAPPLGVADRLKKRLDDHAAAERGIVVVTDEQRLVVIRELWAFWFRDKATHLDVALGRYEAEIKVRVELERAAAAAKAAE
jgi:hypothetical protein